jgi:hypothetical protein
VTQSVVSKRGFLHVTDLWEVEQYFKHFLGPGPRLAVADQVDSFT